MGSTVSVLKSSKVSGLVVRKKKVHDNGENSKRGAETRNENGAYSLTLWKDIPRTKDLVRKMMAEGIIQSETNIKAGYAELRVLLDDPMGQNFLGRFAQRAKTIEVWILLCNSLRQLDKPPFYSCFLMAHYLFPSTWSFLLFGVQVFACLGRHTRIQ